MSDLIRTTFTCDFSGVRFDVSKVAQENNIQMTWMSTNSNVVHINEENLSGLIDCLIHFKMEIEREAKNV